MAELSSILAEETRKYAGSGWGAKLRLFPLLDEHNQTYAVIAVDNPRKLSENFADDTVILILFSRIVGDKIIVETDNTDKPLIDALLQRGIPREQIILAYEGEPIPDGKRQILSPQSN